MVSILENELGQRFYYANIYEQIKTKNQIKVEHLY